MTKVNWDKRFMDLAEHFASWSKDLRRGVGAVIVDPDTRNVLSHGYNGLPRGLSDDLGERLERPAKYLWTEHAERNALYNAPLSVRGATMYCTFFPCAECARAIIQCGIKRLVTRPPDLDHATWGESFTVAIVMLNEVGIEITYID